MFKLFAKKGGARADECYSEVQAEAIGQHVDYVIGMNQGDWRSSSHYLCGALKLLKAMLLSQFDHVIFRYEVDPAYQAATGLQAQTTIDVTR
ncbi:hypothetical protein [Phormidesmis sp. 146-33]